MVESSRISSSRQKTSGALLSSAIKGIPPALQRFYKFTRDIAQKYSRHLAKDRTEEFIDVVAKEFK